MKEVKAPTISFFLAKQRNYCGVLAKPIPWRDGDEGLREALTELVERLSALYAHYRIDPDQTGAESRLLLALAMAHVPGCRVVPSRELGGRAPTSVAELDPFVRDVERLTKKGHSVSRACELLSKRQPYLRLKLKAATLRRRFYEVTRGKNNDRDGIRAARRHHTQGAQLRVAGSNRGHATPFVCSCSPGLESGGSHV